MRLPSLFPACIVLLCACTPATAPSAPEPAPAPAELHAPMALTTDTGPGVSVGEVTISQGATGAEFHLALTGLPPGQHGFHVHAEGSCAPSAADGKTTLAGAAGGHWDPGATGAHMGPAGAGHMGDLPLITVAEDGTDAETVVAAHITDVSQLAGHALMIHANGDNYSDQPAPLGGGGARLACGVIG